MPNQIISIYLIPHKKSLGELERLAQDLSPQEKRYFDQCQSKKRRSEFLCSRLGLRQVLALATEQTPNQVEDLTKTSSRYTTSSKDSVYYNISHSSNFTVIAVDRNDPVGIDLEPIRKTRNKSRLANRYFNSNETKWVGNSSENFLKMWTAKESTVKCLNQGLKQIRKVGLSPVMETSDEVKYQTSIEGQDIQVRSRRLDNDHIVSLASAKMKPVQIRELKL